ncbi:MAG TPA: thioesterase family protein [Hanamia sp.]|nr:thioesterase family protein [Hanamia sp.]
MPRLKIDLPKKILVSVSVPVRITDINYGNHVGNNAIVEIIHEARVQFLKNHGFTELDIAGTAMIMSELLVEYKNQSFYNDLLEINIYCGEITRVAFELFYKITTKRMEEEIIIALAKTGMVCYNYELKKVVQVPQELQSILF